MAAAGKQMRLGALVLAACLAALIQTSMAATSHTVGDSTGWTIPTSNSLYSTWAGKQTFKVGDTLVFNFQTGSHTVAEVSKSAYDACTTSNPISTFSTGPASITLSTAGTHYYICTFPGHCSNGQKLAVTATSSTSSAAPTTSPTSSPAPSTSTTPSSTPKSSPSPATAAAPTPSSTSAEPTPSVATTPTTVPSAQTPSSGTTAPAPSSATVAGAGLLIPPSFNVGDFLVFNYAGSTETVAEVTKPAYDSCSALNPITQVNNGPVNVTITSPGPHYYISTDPGHCSAGQKFFITAVSPNIPPPTTPGSGTPTPAAPAPKSTPSTSPTAPAPRSTTTPPAAPTPKSATPSGAKAPAASTPTETPTGKGGAMTPSTTPSPPSGAMTPATAPTAAPGSSTPMSPAISPMVAPGLSPMSPTGAPSSTISSPPATAPTPAGSAPEPSMDGALNLVDPPHRHHQQQPTAA
ncbi:hypothetical protein V2J09_002854 [Rumex salicifolius]